MQESFNNELQSYAEQLRTTLRAAMARLLADIAPTERVAIALSGGIDSTLTAHLLRELHGSNTVAFSLHVDDYENTNRDLEAAAHVTKVLDLRHEIVHVSPELVVESALPVARLITSSGRRVHDFNVASGIVTHLLGPAIQEMNITKCFGGEGSDELFGSYGPAGSLQIAHAKMTTPDMRQKLFDNLIQLGYLDRTTKTLGAFGIDALSPYLDPAFAAAALEIPAKFLNGKHWKWPLIQAFYQEISSDLQRNLWRPKVRAQVGSGVFGALAARNIDQKFLEAALDLAKQENK